MADASGKNWVSHKACPALGLMQFVYFWLAGKKHISQGQVCPKTNLGVSSISFQV
jgi:hypothetical protein